MSVQLQHFSVRYEYPVHFTCDVLSPDNPALAEALCRLESRRHRVLAFIDRGVSDAWPDLRGRLLHYAERHAGCLQLVSEPLLVEGGEACKNDPSAPMRLLAKLDELSLDRHSFVLAIGGGAMLDLVGFAAATAHRGIRLVRVPSTVLSQADGGLGVKNGVNAFGKKNFLGTFVPPFAVLNDSLLLETLSLRDKRSGMAEAVKVALLKAPVFFAWMETHAEALARAEPEALAILVRGAAKLHLRHIATSGDPFELGSARPLDFGHWAAHKLEVLSEHRLRHGEAVAIGIALDTAYSVERGLLEPAARERVVGLLEALGFRLWDEALALERAGRPRVLDGLAEFREHLGGELTVTLLSAIGKGLEVHDICLERMGLALEWLARRKGAR